jgi:cyclopropane fatty-acyl-phospholipid synthase-like methyltransferase
MGNMRFYKNIRMSADEGLHKKIFDEFLLLEMNNNVSILILGAGQGAFDQRLIDNGFDNIVSIDMTDYYKSVRTNLVLRDLNKDFDDLGKFDYIFALEIIEHLENQFHFIRNIEKIMTDSAILFLSTPNIERKSLRIRFLLKNTLDFFTPNDLEVSGHINIIYDHIFKWNLQESNLNVQKETYNRDFFPKGAFQGGTFGFKILFLLTKMTDKFIPGTEGVIKIYVINKIKPVKLL